MQPRPEAALADDHAEELPLLARLDLAFLPRDEQEGVGLQQAAELQAVLGRLGAEDRAQFQFSGRRRELLPLHRLMPLALESSNVNRSPRPACRSSAEVNIAQRRRGRSSA